MKFRAYGKQTVLSKRHRDADGNPGPLENEDVVAEGSLKNGKATVDAGDAKVSRVVFYRGSGDEETVAGSMDVNESGKFDVEFVEPE
jgi:hypothetical protein